MAARQKFAKRQRSLDAADLIFIDETGCHPGMGPLRGWAPRGEPLWGPEQVYARKQHISIIGAMSTEGILARMTVRGGVGSREFHRFVERYLAPQLRRGHIVLWDNLNAHKNKFVREIVEARGATICFLPPYSPDLNPIEAAWFKLKHFIRKAWAAGIKDLRQAIYCAFRRIQASDAKGWFAHAGYRVP